MPVIEQPESANRSVIGNNCFYLLTEKQFKELKLISIKQLNDHERTYNFLTF